MQVIELTQEQKSAFLQLFKYGVYKELHKRELLTDVQLDRLLSQR